MVDTYHVGDYLVERLRELGVRHIFGVPGDFVLGFNAQIEASPGVAWVGNCNELNAAYAADGYARAHGVGALVVTAGVGDLGAIGGVCGALAERSSVVIISGVPGTTRPCATHHSAGDGDYERFSRVYAEVTRAHSTLTAANAAEEIDRVLRACILEHGPVFIALPLDVAPLPIDRPDQPLDLSEAADEAVVQRLSVAVARRLAQAQRPVVLIDVGIRQARQLERVTAMLAASGVPWAVTQGAAADVIGPASPGYLGAYPSGYGYRSAVEVDDADLVLRLGTRRAERAGPRAVDDVIDATVIDISDQGVSLDGDLLDLPLSRALDAIAAPLADASPPPAGRPTTSAGAPPADGETPAVADDDTLTQDRFWEHLWGYLQPGDVVVADPGSGHFPITSAARPDGITLFNQKTWLAIGWALPAALGAELAAPDKRHIVVIGDGAVSLTVQELSTIARQGCSPLVIVVNNGGYLIEDLATGGRHLDCDDIWVWDYAGLATAFDDRGQYHPLGLQVTTTGQLDEAMKQAAAAQSEGRLVVLDAIFDRDDMPSAMRAFALSRIKAAQASRS